MSTSDVTFAYSSYLNKYTGLFIVAASDMIRGKYNHNYKRTPERLEKDCIMLPADNDSNPDYAFMEAYMKEQEKKKKQEFGYMEQYAKNLILKKYQEYLDWVVV